MQFQLKAGNLKLSKISVASLLVIFIPFSVVFNGQASASQEKVDRIVQNISGNNLNGEKFDSNMSAEEYGELPRGQRLEPLGKDVRNRLLEKNIERIDRQTNELAKKRKSSDEPIPVDNLSLNECQMDYGPISPNPEGLQLSRHIYCVGSTWTATTERCNSKGCTLIARAKWDMFVLGLGSNEGRTASFDVRLTNIRETLGDWRSMKPNLTLLCDPDISTTTCGGGGVHNHNLNTWSLNPDINLEINSLDTSGSIGENKLSWYDVGLNIELGVGSGMVMSSGVRCDSATGLRGAEGCIFDRDTDPWAISQEGDTLGFRTQAVGRHIAQSYNSPDLTIPVKDGKVVPGKYNSSQPLSRTRDTSQINQNRRASVAQCKIHWPDYGSDGQQCDEFPMASTHQGAGTGDGNYSVLVMDAAENKGAGDYLSWWYRSYRMLENDPFWVTPYWPSPE